MWIIEQGSKPCLDKASIRMIAAVGADFALLLEFGGGQGHGVIMPLLDDFEQLLAKPREDVGVEYKSWLDLATNNGKATMAKAAIALANHGGGFIVLGYEEVAGQLVSGERPQNIPPITQDAVNGAVRRYADPEFHVEVREVSNPATPCRPRRPRALALTSRARETAS